MKGENEMKLGKNIFTLRKQQGLSQEQLGELVNVTRQTISNWELGETAPNPEQLKLLSKALNTSIDELLDNDIKGVLETKVNNTEKLAGIIIKILKAIGILFVILVVIDVIAFIMFVVIKKEPVMEYTESIELSCSLSDNEYIIEVGTDGYFNCSNCSKKLQKELKNQYIDFENISKTEENINNYFKSQGGFCK